MQRNDLEIYTVNAADWWDESALFYTLNHLNEPRFEYFDRHLPNWNGVKVLDVGCGGGFSCEFMAKRGAIVSGVDLSPACIESARLHAQKTRLTIDYRAGVAEQLPFESNQFDCVVCVDVLEHIADLAQTLREVSRVLKPGGIFFFDTPNRTLFSKIVLIWVLEDILRKIPRGIHDWNKFIKPEELIPLLRSQGFGNIEIEGFNLLGRNLREHVQAYRYYRQTQRFQVKFGDPRSLMYIGKALKLDSESATDAGRS
jgi:2-polyprenyl-6-hydroxyphenyl methylase/3-demethylubiquinone-9 3-methyltransferase